MLSEAAAQGDEPVPGYLSAPQNIMDTCLYIFTSGTTGEDWIQYHSDTETEGGKVWGGTGGLFHSQVTLDTIPGTASLLPAPRLPTFPGRSSAASLTMLSCRPSGLPKAARISHLKVLQCQGFYQLCGVHREDVIYLALPLYHMSGSLLGVVGCLGIG